MSVQELRLQIDLLLIEKARLQDSLSNINAKIKLAEKLIEAQELKQISML